MRVPRRLKERPGRIPAGFVAMVAEENRPFLSPKKVAKALGIAAGDLAAHARVSRNTLARAPHSTKVQRPLGDYARIIDSATEITGDLAKAIQWFKFQPLMEYDYRRPIELVRDGHTEALLAYLERIKDGVAA